MLSPPPRPVVPGDYEFHRDAWFQQLGAVGFSTGGCQPMPTPPATTADQRVGFWIGALRRGISEHVYNAAGEKGGGMSAAMVAGDRSFITPDDSEALRLSGLAHLLSISGVHMVLVGGVVFFAIRLVWPFIEPLALRAPAVRAAALGAIITCSLYFAISGGEVATQRAYVMALIGFGAKLFDRPALSLRSLAIALAIVVLIQPEAVVTPGFQMSFAASGSLIALYEAWPRLDRPASRGAFSRLRGWFAGALATSAIASAATLPFALYHFDRAAVFSVVANIVSTPVMTLWTTPAAIAAAIASLVGVDEPFLRLMGWSLEVVIGIAHWAVDVSPDVDLPRMNVPGVVWGALAIGVFCLASGRGKALAAAPLAGMFFAWLSAPAPVGYIADDGSVFLKAENGWLELTDWRGRNGLNPLIIGDEIAKAPCPGKGQACTLDLPAGRFSVAPGEGEALAVCPSSAVLTFTLAGNTTTTSVRPCDHAGQGGAVLETAGGELKVRTAQKQSGRAWTQPLHEARGERR
jgi:competence protein ComEC